VASIDDVMCDVVANSGKSSMKDEYELHQQMQRDSSPTDSCRLPEWNSSSPYLASTLRHLHATDHQLDGRWCDIDHKYTLQTRL